MATPLRRMFVLVAAGLLFAAALIYAFMPQSVPVDSGIAIRGPMQVFISDEGETRIKDVYVVSTPVSGRVLRIESHVGDTVIASRTVLAVILPHDPTFLDVREQSQAEAAVNAADAARSLADADLKRATAELEFARADLNRARALVVNETISQRALERAVLEVETREASVATAEATLQVRNFELENARAALIVPDSQEYGGLQRCCVEVRSPVHGSVLKVMHESEGVLNAGTALLEIGDPRDLEIVADFLSADAVKVREGADVIIDAWGGESVLTGRVRRIEPYGFTKVSALGIEEQRVNIIIDFADAPTLWRALGHGYRVETRVVIWSAKDVLKVPVSALFRKGDDWAVFVQEGGRARLRLIEVGHSSDQEAEIKNGLVAGERVVLHPSDRISEGSRIVERQDG